MKQVTLWAISFSLRKFQCSLFFQLYIVLCQEEHMKLNLPPPNIIPSQTYKCSHTTGDIQTSWIFAKPKLLSSEVGDVIYALPRPKWLGDMLTLDPMQEWLQAMQIDSLVFCSSILSPFCVKEEWNTFRGFLRSSHNSNNNLSDERYKTDEGWSLLR